MTQAIKPMSPTIILTLNVDSVNVILSALSKLPYDTVVGLIADITNQGQTQLAAAQQPPAAANAATNTDSGSTEHVNTETTASEPPPGL